MTNLITALGHIERTIIHSPATAVDNRLSPLPMLSTAWLESAFDGSVEFRLACSLASIRGLEKIGAFRSNMIPCNPEKPWLPYDSSQIGKPHVVWQHGSLVDNLLDVLHRRCMDAERYRLKVLPLHGTFPVSINDVQAFIRGDTDEKRIEELLWGLNAVDWRSEKPPWKRTDKTGMEVPLPSCYALLKLTHATLRPDGTAVAPNMPGVPIDPAILAQATAGRIDATRTAARRLKASGWRPLITVASGAPDHIRRCAAAVLFPISRYDFRMMAHAVMRYSVSSDVANRTETLSIAD